MSGAFGGRSNGRRGNFISAEDKKWGVIGGGGAEGGVHSFIHE